MYGTLYGSSAHEVTSTANDMAATKENLFKAFLQYLSMVVWLE